MIIHFQPSKAIQTGEGVESALTDFRRLYLYSFIELDAAMTTTFWQAGFLEFVNFNFFLKRKNSNCH